MDKEENIGFWDKKSLWFDKHKPGKSKHTLAGATYKLKDLSPFDIDMSGATINRGVLLLITSMLLYLIYWAWYGWINKGFINYELLETMTLVAIIVIMAVVLIISATLIDYHKGSFTPYIKILEMRVRSLLRKSLKRVEFKVKDYVELYNPVTGGYWRKLSDYEKDIEEEEFEPVDLEDEEMPFAMLEGKRFHSIRDMRAIMEMALTTGEVVQTKDEIKEILNLKRRFIDLAEMIRLPFHCTLCECDSKGGKVYPLFISEHSLFGGSGGQAEFRDHTLAQRTWAGLVSKDNVRAGVGEGIELGMYKFYELVPDEFALLGKKEEKLKFSPVIFITASDAQAEKMMNDFRYNDIRESPVQQDLIDVSVIHDSSVADELFEMIKLITARLKRKEKSEEETRKDSVYDSKDMVHKGLEKSLITERAGKTGMLSRINLLSNRSVKYLFYIVAVLSISLLALYIVHYYGGINIGWLFPPPGLNETLPPDDWTGMWKPLWEWIK